MKDNTLSKNFESAYEKVSIIPQERDKSEMFFFLNLISKEDSKTVLDLGCAEGEFALLLAGNGYEVTAADISSGYLAQLNKLAKNKNLNLKTVKCDIEQGVGEFKGRKYDVIFFTAVIEHLRNVPLGLENIRKLLNDKGILIINTPNVLTIGRFLRAIVKRKTLVNYFNPESLGDLHFSTFDYLTLEKTLNFQGLKVQEIIPTKLSLPKMDSIHIFHPLYRFLSRLFPFLSDSLLVKCVKTDPIDLKESIEYWDKKYNKK